MVAGNRRLDVTGDVVDFAFESHPRLTGARARARHEYGTTVPSTTPERPMRWLRLARGIEACSDRGRQAPNARFHAATERGPDDGRHVHNG